MPTHNQTSRLAGHAEPPRFVRRLSWLTWMVCGLPMAALLALLLRPQHHPFIQPLARLELGLPLSDASAGSDRKGDHYAVADRHGGVYLIRLKAGRLHAEPLHRAGLVGSSWMIWSDIDADDLLDLRVVAAEPRALDGEGCASGFQRSEPPLSAVYLQQGNGLKLRGLGRQHLVGAVQRSPDAVCRGEQWFRLGFRDSGGPLTLLNTSRGVAQTLRGEAVEVGDLNGDSCQEVLTADRSLSEGEDWVRYRLFSPLDHGYTQVWQMDGPCLPPNDAVVQCRPLAEIADLDGDGRGELLIADPLTGQLQLFTWQEATPAP
ncbi:MAG: hypothetical protein HUU35_01310 [Armatimonadetes bacterium]|nr:hypothetical protein [Armatimonadota bacterium]